MNRVRDGKGINTVREMINVPLWMLARIDLIYWANLYHSALFVMKRASLRQIIALEA